MRTDHQHARRRAKPLDRLAQHSGAASLGRETRRNDRQYAAESKNARFIDTRDPRCMKRGLLGYGLPIVLRPPFPSMPVCTSAHRLMIRACSTSCADLYPSAGLERSGRPM